MTIVTFLFRNWSFDRVWNKCLFNVGFWTQTWTF